MINEQDFGKEAKPSLREAIKMAAPDECIGACSKCGDYLFEDKDKKKAVCCYCGHEEDLPEQHANTSSRTAK